MERGQPAFALDGGGLQIGRETVRGVNVGARMFAPHDLAQGGVLEAVHRLEHRVMRAVAPGKAREFSRCDQLGFLFRGEALPSEQEAARVLQPVFVELQLPGSVPPKVRLDFDTAAQRVSAGQMARFDRERASRLPSVQSSVGGLRGERRVDGILGPRRLHFEACAGAVTQLAPFVRTEDRVRLADRRVRVGQFDLAADAAHEEAGLRHGMRKITRLTR